MAGINPQAIKELRERTQAGMSDCKSALTEAGGDMEKAVEIILKKGLAKSAKRAGAVASEGEVRASVSPDKRAATLIEVNIQTDFSARSDEFKTFVGEAATRVVDRALSLSGGAGYLNGSPLARAYRDVRAGGFMHPLGANRAYDFLADVAIGRSHGLR